MSMNEPLPPVPIDLSSAVVGLGYDGRAELLPGNGHPAAFDGYSVGAPVMTEPAPHRGERHPDGDELLYLISGRVSVILEEAVGDRTVPLAPGQAFVVPRGVWHRVERHEASHLVHVTPGPGGEHRPLDAGAAR